MQNDPKITWIMIDQNSSMFEQREYEKYKYKSRKI